MDEQRVWIRSRRKKRLRFIAAMLVFCLLVTTYPDILETTCVLAAGSRDKGEVMSISGFGELPEEVRGQNVPMGTDISELELPDTLEAYVTVDTKTPTVAIPVTGWFTCKSGDTATTRQPSGATVKVAGSD